MAQSDQIQLPEAQFRRRMAEGEIPLVRCGVCKASHYYPSLACRSCGSRALEPVEASGKGRVYACTLGTMPPHAPIALVELDEGPRVLTTTPEMLPIGALVQGVIEPYEDRHRLVFQAVP